MGGKVLELKSEKLLNMGREEGREEGIEEGIEKGIEKGTLDQCRKTVKAMLQDNAPEDKIKQYSGATQEIIDAVKAEFQQ